MKLNAPFRFVSTTTSQSSSDHPHAEAVARDACVVDENVDARKVGVDFLNEFRDGFVVGDIDGIRFGRSRMGCVDFVGGLCGVGFGAADDGDFRALTRKAKGDGVADSPARAGDDGDLVFESIHKVVLATEDTEFNEVSWESSVISVSSAALLF